MNTRIPGVIRTGDIYKRLSETFFSTIFSIHGTSEDRGRKDIKTGVVTDRSLICPEGRETGSGRVGSFVVTIRGGYGTGRTGEDP